MNEHVTTRTLLSAWLAGLMLAVPASHASPIGQEVANQVDQASYQHYLEDLLFTHDGDDRGYGPEHDLARDNIAATFESLGLQVELHPFQYDSVWYYNVVATQTGVLYADLHYVIGAHYDSVGNPGADDNASGVAGVMEIARILSQYDSSYTIKYMAFDREEQWMVGSTAYVNDHINDDIRGMINLDMIAWDRGEYAGNLFCRDSSLPLRNAFIDAVNEYGDGLNLVVHEGTVSDQWPFEEAGFQACLLIEDTPDDIWGRLGNPCYHMACDSVDTPDYIHYPYALDMTRSAAGLLADQAGIHSSGDCNSDGIPDSEQIQADPSLDCTGNGILDECEADCNENSTADSCDIAEGTSPDANENEIPDECEFGYLTAAEDPTWPGAPTSCSVDEDCPDQGVCRTGICYYPYNRFLRVRVSPAGSTVAIRVRHVASGATRFLSVPFEADDLHPSRPATFVYADSDVPVFVTWPDEPVNVMGCFVGSAKSGRTAYEIQTLCQGCDAANETHYSVPLSLPTARFGDTQGLSPATPPDGTVNIVDVVGCLTAFTGDLDVSILQYEMTPEVPEPRINITDAVEILNAFIGQDYRFSAPQDCPLGMPQQRQRSVQPLEDWSVFGPSPL